MNIGGFLIVGLGPFYFISYALIPIMLVLMFKNYRQANWAWLAILIASFFIGVAPFVALAYLFVYRKGGAAKEGVEYRKDGSYTMYSAEQSKAAPSPGKLAFRIVGGLIAGLSVAAGLFIVGIILLFTLAPSIACGGSSKCM